MEIRVFYGHLVDGAGTFSCRKRSREILRHSSVIGPERVNRSSLCANSVAWGQKIFA